MIIIVSLMLLKEGKLQEIKVITLPIYNRIQNLKYIRGPPSEEKNPPAQDQPTGLHDITYTNCMQTLHL